MAGEEAKVTDTYKEDYDDDKHHDIKSLLAAEGRDFLVRNNGAEVKINELEGKIVGLYFSGSWCGPCQRFTPILANAYTELASRGSDFEIVFVSSDEDDEEFSNYFSKMPWLAIPFSDEDKRNSLSDVFHVEGIPTLVIIDKSGEVLTDEAVQVIRDFGAEGYPFTAKMIEKLKEEDAAAKMNQTIKSLLVTTSRDFLLTSNFKKVPVSDLEGKIVGLYFSLSSFKSCASFTRRLVKIYNELKANGENFEIVLVSLEEDEPSFNDAFKDMPWLGIPFKDKLREKLGRYFELKGLPTLVVIGVDGKTVNSNAVELIEDYGTESFPFTSEKFKELEMARTESQTLESLLVSEEKDYVIKNDGSKVSVSDLTGKIILLYFSAHWCPPCRAFLPDLIEMYKQIKEKDDAFEIIFISSDMDDETFKDYFSKMPWLALPFADERKRFLSRIFKISGIPSCVVIDRAGKTLTKDARNLIMDYGANAYPFTKESIIQLKTEMEEKAKHLPEKIRHKDHSHVLWKVKRGYVCDGCGKSGRGWSFYCKKCDFDLHPDCALGAGYEVVGSEDEVEEERERK